jgi:hypothetical protein
VQPADLPDEGEGEPYALLLLWAESVADFVCLPPRLRARLLAQLAGDIRQALAGAPDKELIYPWQIRRINEAFGFEVIPPPPRARRFAPEGEEVRIIGGG